MAENETVYGEVEDFTIDQIPAGHLGTVDVAEGKVVTPITTAAPPLPNPFYPSNVTDGNLNDAWYSYQGTIPNRCQFTVDLQQSYYIGQIALWLAQVNQVTISTSTDGRELGRALPE